MVIKIFRIIELAATHQLAAPKVRAHSIILEICASEFGKRVKTP
jgi:hypothetical protein